MEDYLIGIGKQIKKIRKDQKKTLSETAQKAGVTSGLISRIENGRTIPSLPVLLNIITALEMEVSEFFKEMHQIQGSNFIVSRKETYEIIEKEVEAKGFIYRHIFGKQLSSLGFESVLLEVQPGSKREKIATDAFEFKYVLSGECYYIIGNEEVLLKEGDSIFFDGRVPHCPVNRSSKTTIMIVFYFFV